MKRVSKNEEKENVIKVANKGNLKANENRSPAAHSIQLVSNVNHLLLLNRF